MRSFKWILLVALYALSSSCRDGPRGATTEFVPGPGGTPGGLASARRGHAMTTVGGDLVLVTGGLSLCVPATDTAEIIDASPDGTVVSYATDSAAYTFSTSLPLPHKLADVAANALTVSRKGHTAIASENGVLIFGGRDQVGSALGSLEIFDVAWTNDGSRAVFTANRDNPNHFEPWSVDADGNDLRKLGSTQTDPGTPFSSVFLPSPKGNGILAILDTDDGTPQLFFGPADGSEPLQQLSPAPGETGGVDDDVRFSPDGSAVHFTSDGELYSFYFGLGETARVSADGPGAVTTFEPTLAGGVVFEEDDVVYGADPFGTIFLFDKDDNDTIEMTLPESGLHVAVWTRADRLLFGAVDGSSSDELEFDGEVKAIQWAADDSHLRVIWHDPVSDRDIFGRYDPASRLLSREFLLGLDQNVNAEYETVGDSIIRIEGIGSNTTLASIVTEDGVTPICLNYRSAIAMPEFPVDPAAEICSQQLLPAMTFTDLNDPTDSYLRHGLLTRRRGGQYVLRDFDPGRVFANRARVVGDVTTAPTEIEGLDPSFQHFYSYPQSVQALGSDIVLTFNEGLYTDPLGQRTVTQPARQTTPIQVAAGPGGAFVELTVYLDLGDLFLSADGRIFPK